MFKITIAAIFIATPVAAAEPPEYGGRFEQRRPPIVYEQEYMEYEEGPPLLVPVPAPSNEPSSRGCPPWQNHAIPFPCRR